MLIKDLQPRQTNVDVEGEVLEVSDVREFTKFGRQGRVASAIITDGSGKVKLSLWNEQIEQVKPGDTVRIMKGYVSEFQGELQLTTGKFGTLEVVKGDGKEGVAAEEEKPPEPEPEPEQQAASSEGSAPEKNPLPEEAEPEKKVTAPQESLDVEEEDFS